MKRQRPIITTAIACALAMPTLVGAEPLSDATVRLEVDVSALPKDRLAEDTRTWVIKHQTTAFEAAGFVVTEDARRAVRIEISRYGEYGMHTKARLMVVGDEGSTREFTCEACRDSQFLAKVSEETAALAEEMRTELEVAREPAADQESVAVPRSAPTIEDEGTEPEQGKEPAEDEGKQLGAAGYAGIGALALGAGMTLGGGLVLARPQSSRLRPDHDQQLEVTDRAPLGAGLTGAGVALLVAGAVMITLDQTVLRKPAAGRARASVVVPVISPANLGLSWVARF